MREISTDSVATWHARYVDTLRYGERLERMPPEMLEEWSDVVSGVATLIDADGQRWWCPITGDVMAPRAASAPLEVLIDMLIDHKMLAGHMGPRLPIILLEATTVDPRRAFCCECNRAIDLSEDSREIDSQGNRVPEDE